MTYFDFFFFSKTHKTSINTAITMRLIPNTPASTNINISSKDNAEVELIVGCCVCPEQALIIAGCDICPIQFSICIE